LGVNGLDPAGNHSVDQAVFGLEMVVDGSQIDVGFGGDIAQGSGFETIQSEEFLGSIEDPAFSVTAGIHTIVSIIRLIQPRSQHQEVNIEKLTSSRYTVENDPACHVSG
jgi:hypothetical protein